MNDRKNESIFVIHREAILQDESLQALVLHLYNNERWQFDLADRLSRMDAGDMVIAVGIMLAYHAKGQDDQALIDLGHELWGHQQQRAKQTTAELDGPSEFDEAYLDRMADEVVRDMLKDRPLSPPEEAEPPAKPRWNAPRR